MRLLLLLFAAACGPGAGVYRAAYDLEHAGCCSQSCFSSSTRATLSLSLHAGGRATQERDRQGWSVVSSAREAGLGDRMEGAPERDARDLAAHSVDEGRWWRWGRVTLVKVGSRRLRCRRAGELTACFADGADWQGFAVCGDVYLDTRPGLIVEERTIGFSDCPPNVRFRHSP
jgi:hypothetical protein